MARKRGGFQPRPCLMLNLVRKPMLLSTQFCVPGNFYGSITSGQCLQHYLRRTAPTSAIPSASRQGEVSVSPDPTISILQPQKVVEAILMISKEPLSARRLASLAGLEDPTQARSIARQLNEYYDSEGHAFRIEEVAGGMQLLTRPQFAHWVRRLEHIPGEELLSQGMLETLAIVAYRQPILRAEIEAIRGVACDEVLRQLMQRDLVRISGRQEELGRPFLYGTTRRFLQLFGLQSLEALPRAKKLRQAE
jgi:segregation and condensation protein B